jgi:SAM-dependent methyltransferase
VTNASFEQADAQVHPFPASSFDVAISRTGALFFGDPVAAFANVARALRPGGRLALLTWQPPTANKWIGDFASAMAAGRDLPAPPPDAPGPFSLSDPGRVRDVLTAAGFTDVTLDAASGPMWFGSDVADAHRFLVGFMGWMLQGLDDRGRARALDDLRQMLEAHESADGVTLPSGVWTIRASS